MDTLSTPTTALQIKKLDPNAIVPQRAHPGDAGLDLFSTEDKILPPHEPIKIKTGLAMAIPFGNVGLICDRSSMGAQGIRTLGGVIDAGYRGEVQVLLINLKNNPFEIKRGQKIAQLLVQPVQLYTPAEVFELEDSARSLGGFGSTGV